MDTRIPTVVISIWMLGCVLDAGAADPIDIGTRRELFVDRHLIDRMTDTQLVLNRPHPEGVALRFDQPWEGGFSGYPRVFKDGDRFRLYYRGLPVASADGSDHEVVCYAESTDGKEWKKPKLGLFEVHGTRANNVVLANAAPVAHNFTPFIDGKPGVPLNERYKALGGTLESGLIAYTSADGIRWRKLRDEPVFTRGVFDSQNVAFWSESEEKYVLYFRTWSEGDFREYRGLRSIGRTTSDDFFHWTEPVEMTYGDSPREHLYTNATQPYFRAPHLYIGMAKRFFPGKVTMSAAEAERLVDNPDYRRASADAVLLSSRGGNRYDRTFMESFIPPGATLRDWIARSNAPACGLAPVSDRTMFIYRLSHYAQPTAHLSYYSLRTDGFASVRALHAGGELLTKPIVFGGDRLELNAATSAAGGIRVELLDEDGPISGFTLGDCQEVVGDRIAHIVSWGDAANLGKLKGRALRMRFVMKDADLYSFRFF